MPASKSSHSMLAQPVLFPPILSCSALTCKPFCYALSFKFLPLSPAPAFQERVLVFSSSGWEEPLTDENSFLGHTAEDNWIWYHSLSKCTPGQHKALFSQLLQEAKNISNYQGRKISYSGPGSKQLLPFLQHSTFYGQFAFFLIGFQVVYNIAQPSVYIYYIHRFCVINIHIKFSPVFNFLLLSLSKDCLLFI